MACSFLYAHQAPLLPETHYDSRVSSQSYLNQDIIYTEPNQTFSRSSSSSSTSTLQPVPSHPQTLQPQNHSRNYRYPNSTEHPGQSWQDPSSSHSLPLALGQSMVHHGIPTTTGPHSIWIPQSNIHTTSPSYPDLYSPHSPAVSRTKSWPPPQHHYQPPVNHGLGWQGGAGLKTHSHSSSGEWKAHKRSSSHQQQQQQQMYASASSSSPPNNRTSPVMPGHSSSRSSRSSSTTSVFSSPPTSPFPYTDVPSSASSSGSTSTSSACGPLTPVHELYAGLARTESGLIPIPLRHVFTRGEIVMTRTTRRLMRTSSTSRLTARHPCLILEVSPTQTHVRVLQMTSHVNLTEEQVRVVGAQLRHWLAREDEGHQDAFGRMGLQTSPPSNRAGYIWVGDGGEWVPIESVKYLTGTRVNEGEVRRLESFIAEHEAYIPFRPSSDGGK